ncbi:phosphatases II [Dendrothele bispora CBS 962.96]|uniref:Phosphatases II n=1 Tax=Dendrothele bispora (strain CBS 962.96) TaxID=1314807 RepID=A0A4S8MX74_DENBC|nr:phosphatases II [Dendrothele bispora CBS 962.96]
MSSSPTPNPTQIPLIDLSFLQKAHQSPSYVQTSLHILSQRENRRANARKESVLRALIDFNKEKLGGQLGVAVGSAPGGDEHNGTRSTPTSAKRRSGPWALTKSIKAKVTSSSTSSASSSATGQPQTQHQDDNHDPDPSVTWYSTSIGSSTPHAPQNRYFDVVPYDRTRVILASAPSPTLSPTSPTNSASPPPTTPISPSSASSFSKSHAHEINNAPPTTKDNRITETKDDLTSYLNASWVRELYGHKTWIATQAPLPETVHTFLRVLLGEAVSPGSFTSSQHGDNDKDKKRRSGSGPQPELGDGGRPRTIVQLTRNVENGSRKAHPYLPERVGEEWGVVVWPPIGMTTEERRGRRDEVEESDDEYESAREELGSGEQQQQRQERGNRRRGGKEKQTRRGLRKSYAHTPLRLTLLKKEEREEARCVISFVRLDVLGGDVSEVGYGLGAHSHSWEENGDEEDDEDEDVYGYPTDSDEEEDGDGSETNGQRSGRKAAGKVEGRMGGKDNKKKKPAASSPGTSIIFQHLLFHAWPDHGVPEDSDLVGLVNFIGLVDEINRAPVDFKLEGKEEDDDGHEPGREKDHKNGGEREEHEPEVGGRREVGGLGDGDPDPDPPIIINCSAGIGRTGSFIAISSLLRAVGMLLPAGVGRDTSDESSNEGSTVRGEKGIGPNGGGGADKSTVSNVDDVNSSPLGPLPTSHMNDMVVREIDWLREQRPGMVQRPEQVVLVYRVFGGVVLRG